MAKSSQFAVITLCAASILILTLSTVRAAEAYSTAGLQARTAAASRPSAYEVHAALYEATRLIEGSRYQDAAQTLESLSCLRCDPRVSLLLSAALEGSGNTIEARHTLEEAHSFWPSNNSIATALARQYLLMGRIPQAIEALSSAQVTATTPLQELTLRAEVYLAAGQLLDAQHVALIAYKTHHSEESALLLANVLQMEGRPQDAVALLQNKRKSYMNSPSFLITLAESEYDTRSYEAAQADLARAISLDRSSDQAHYLLGNTLLKLGETKQSVEEYHTAIRLAPRKPRTYYHLALALLKLGDEPGAKQSLNQALALDDHYAPAHCELGELLLRSNRLPQAVNEFKTAIQCDPTFEVSYYLLARTYARMRKHNQSQEMFQRFLSVRDANRRRVAPQNRLNPPASDREPKP